MKYYYWVHRPLIKGSSLFRSKNLNIALGKEEYLQKDGTWKSILHGDEVRVKTYREGVQKIKQLVGNVPVQKYGEF